MADASGLLRNVEADGYAAHQHAGIVRKLRSQAVRMALNSTIRSAPQKIYIAIYQHISLRDVFAQPT